MNQSLQQVNPLCPSANSLEDDNTEIRMKILSSNPPYKGEEEAICKDMVESLTEIQQEQAARTSYAYFVASTMSDMCSTDPDEESKSSVPQKRPSVEERKKTAMKMARRHLVAEKGNREKALAKMIATLEYREEMRVDDIRRCFSDPALSDLRELIESDICSSQSIMIRGYDTSDRSFLLKFNRTKFNMDAKAFMMINLYWVERALACTERRSHGREEKMNMAADYNGYKRENKPPMGLVREIVGVMQAHYPERLHYWIAVDPPLLFRAVWKVVSLFLDPVTKKKTKFVHGDEQKEKELGSILSKDQVMPFLLPGGKLTSEIDMKKFLYDVPFDHTYDEA